MAMIVSDIKAAAAPAVGAETTCPPAWVRSLDGAGCGVFSAIIRDAHLLGALDLQHAVCNLYTALGERLRASGHPHAIRMWNFIPHIHERMGTREGRILDRYMVFNAGRYAAFTRWYGQAAVGLNTPTATGIGHSGGDLVVHCLASAEPGTSVENPRQIPACRYSRRRGPMPPCFARATIATLNGERVLMAGGTASVRGESSVHPGDIRAQTCETFCNMAALVLGKADPTGMQEEAALAKYRTLRIHCVFSADIPTVRELVEERFSGLESVEYVRADVCRRTLLVEIEGTASA